MQPGGILGRGLAVALVLALAGCPLFRGTTSPAPRQDAATSPTASPAPGVQAAATPTPIPESPLPPEAVPKGLLSELELGYLVSNNAAGLRGSVSGPQSLVSNNAAGLVSNNAAGLVSNNAAGLVSHNAASYRIQADPNINVAAGFVYLTAPDERFYVSADRRLYGTLTDAAGAFSLTAPATEDLIVNVLLSGNRRLTALVNTKANPDASISVNVATTLVTEYLRAKAPEFGYSLAMVFSAPRATDSLADLTKLTGDLLASGSIPVVASDLTINNLPLLRQRYVVGFGTGTDKRLSDKWVEMFRRLTKKTDPTLFPDVLFRPLAVTTVDTGGAIPAGDQVLAVAVGPAGAPNEKKLYVGHLNANTTRLTEFPPGGPSRILLEKSRAAGDTWAIPGTIVALADGRLVIMDAGSFWIGLLDPAKAIKGYVGLGDPFEGTEWFKRPDPDYTKWTNPKALVDTFCAAHRCPDIAYLFGQADEPEPDANPDTISSAEDVAFDDQGNLYYVDLVQHALWKVPNPLSASATAGAFAELVAGARDVPFTGEKIPDKAADLRFNNPAKLTFHKAGSKRYLYVADNGDHVVVRIDLDSRDVQRAVGELPGPSFSGKGIRKPRCYGVPASEEGADPTKAHLRHPQEILFDAGGRMILADADNRLIRLATVNAANPKIWTIAGVELATNANCEAVEFPRPYQNGDGEARNVALGEVSGMALDPDGNVLLTDVRASRVRKLWTSFLK